MADDQHITREILRALDRGELSLHDLYRLARHLTSLCPDCRQAVETYRKEEVKPEISDRVAAVVERASRLSSRMGSAKARAVEMLEQLRRAPAIERSARLTTLSPLEPPLLEELLVEVRSQLTQDPVEALSWAEVALEALELVDDALPSQWVLVHAAHVYALRATGALHEAEIALARTRALADEMHADEPHVTAELDCVEGSLHSDFRRFDRAEERLRSAARGFDKLGDAVAAAEAYIKLGNLYTYAGNLDAALETMRKAVRCVPLEESPRLYLYARFNIVHILVIGEQFQEAFDYLESDRDLYLEHADRHLDIRLSWTYGRIAAGTGDFESAEHHLLEARDGFAVQGIGFDVALVSLDLALLYHRQGRLEDLKHAAIEAAYLFEQHTVHREALAALTMLRDAALEERVTAATIEQIAEFLRTAARDPRARFVQSH